MLLDKEYPATHSMATAWYMVDDDDNVAIIEYNENGPVPWDVPEGEGISSLLFGPNTDEDRLPRIPFAITEEQVDDFLSDLIEHPRAPDDVERWSRYVVQIDPTRTEEFYARCREGGLPINTQISKRRGLYIVNFSSCIKEIYEPTYRKVIDEQSVMRQMVDSGILTTIYDLKFFDVEDEYNEAEGRMEFSTEFKTMPYYIYVQPYWVAHLAKRMITPRHPVKLSQVPEEFRSRIHRIPGRFADKEYLQIAQHTPCKVYGYDELTYSYEIWSLTPLPMEDGLWREVICHIPCWESYGWRPDPSEGYEEPDPEDWYQNIRNAPLTHQPTVVMIGDPKKRWFLIDKAFEHTDRLIRHTMWIPYVPRLPKKYAHYDYDSAAAKSLTDEVLAQLLADCKYLDWVVRWIRPHVLLLDDDAQAVFEQVYPITDHRVQIDGETYPIYLLSERKRYAAEIEHYAQQPYRGEVQALVDYSFCVNDPSRR